MLKPTGAHDGGGNKGYLLARVDVNVAQQKETWGGERRVIQRHRTALDMSVLICSSILADGGCRKRKRMLISGVFGR